MSLEATSVESPPGAAVDVTVRRIVTAVSVLLLLGVATLGALILQDFTHALSPELDRRAAQIGQTIRDDVVRAVEIGVPVDRLVGLDEYLETFVEEFDEVEHLAVRAVSGDSLAEVGATDRAVVRSFPVGDTGEFGTVDVGIDQYFVASRLRDLGLDVLVILVVALLVIYEVTVTVTRRIVGGAGLMGRVAAAGGGRGHPSDIRLVLFLFAVAEELNKSFLPIFIAAADNPIPVLSPAVIISLPFVAYLATLAVASPLAGQLVARVGQRRLLLLGLAAAATSHAGMSMAQDVVQIVLLRGLTGAGYALATIACQEYLLSRLAPGQRTRAIGMFVSVIIGGTFAGTALGGVLADRLGQRAVFVVSAVLVVAVAILGLRMLERTGPAAERPARFVPEDVRAVLRNRRFVLLLGGVTVPMNVLMAGFLWYLVPLGMDAIGSTPSAIARSLMIYYLAIRLVGPAIARQADLRSNPRTMVGWGSVVAGLALFLPAVAPSTTTFTLAVLGLGLGHAAVRGPQITLAIDLAQEVETSGGRAATLAVVRFVERSGSLAGLLTVAVIAAFQGPDAATASMAMVASVAALAFLATQGRPVVKHA